MLDVAGTTGNQSLCTRGQWSVTHRWLVKSVYSVVVGGRLLLVALVAKLVAALQTWKVGRLQLFRKHQLFPKLQETVKNAT